MYMKKAKCDLRHMQVLIHEKLWQQGVQTENLQVRIFYQIILASRLSRNSRQIQVCSFLKEVQKM